MTQAVALKYALVTPTFRLDLERCALLIESVERWVAQDVNHYLVIDARDVALFKPILNRRTKVLMVEDIVPKWLIRVPGMRRFWLSLRTRPVKNWILQQIVKLSVPAVVGEDVLMYADSDMFFIDEFDPRTFERGNLVPLLVETGQRGLIPFNDHWQAVASRLLGIPVETNCDTNYIGNLVWWRRENALAAVGRIQAIAGSAWQQAIAPLGAFSEYILYGIYCQRILGEKSGHWNDGTLRTLNYWRTTPLSVQELESFKAQRLPQHHSVMVSAKSKTAVADIRKVFFS